MPKNILNKYSIRTVLSIVATIVLLLTSGLDKKLDLVHKSGSLPTVNIQTGSLTLITLPEDKNTTVLKLTNEAQKNVDLVMYDLKDKDVGDALVSAHNRGLKVRVLLNKGYYGKQEDRNESSFNYLKSKGLDVRWTPMYFALTHQKTLIVDDKAYIMTYNLVPKYYGTGRDFGIITTNTNDVLAIKQTFDADFNGEQIDSIDGDSLLWSPGAEDKILATINKANKTLEIYNELMNHQKVTDTIVNACERGVDVKIVMTYASTWRLPFAQLRNAGCHVRTYEGKKSIYIHAKMIISDSNYAYLGSQNFSENSLNKNRELGLFITDPSILSELHTTFVKDWDGGKDF